MGIRLFYLSLLILSIAMGSQFYKNRPKQVPKKPPRPAASVNLDELDLQHPPGMASGSDETPEPTGAEIPEGATASPSSGISSESAAIHPSDEQATSTTDAVILAFEKLQRNPFEPSPFEKMIEQAQASAAAEIAANPTRTSKTKPTEIMTTTFGGTIETKNALVAIIDRNVYRTGDTYLGKTIRKIEKTHITLDDAEKIYLLPKFGVKIQIKDDTLSVVDEFKKGKGQ